MTCPHFQAIDEYLAVGVAPELLPGQHRQHLEACASCSEAVAESLELGRLLQEPLLLPPADLTARILAAVKTPSPRRQARPAQQERLLWAALGAAAASLVPVLFQWDPTPVTQAAAALLPAWQLSLPGLDATWAVVGATVLLGAQASVLWGVRRSEGAA